MPRITDRGFSKEFVHNRDGLLAVVRRLAPDQAAAIARAGGRLDAEFTDAAIRAHLKAQTQSRAKRSGHSSPVPKPTVNRVRAERLVWAMQDAVAAIQKPDDENPLGPHLKRGVRERNAIFYTVVAGLVLDPDAEDWLGGVTESAKCPWTRARRATERNGRERATARLTGYFDRAAVFRDFGPDALALLVQSSVALGWIRTPLVPVPVEQGRAGVSPIPTRVIAVDQPNPGPPRPLPDQIGALQAALNVFYQTLDATTVPVEGGRCVDGVAQAVALSETTWSLHTELTATIEAVLRAHGVPQSELPVGLRLMAADAPKALGQNSRPRQSG
ncbi:MAG: hypothetical protein IPK72_21680 [Candidatus Eisenbacteria bacterium]|nr:hypothetical protein [Candidatus Eisenbacteria bacterium]